MAFFCGSVRPVTQASKTAALPWKNTKQTIKNSKMVEILIMVMKENLEDLIFLKENTEDLL
jgi:hypothetical protein